MIQLSDAVSFERSRSATSVMEKNALLRFTFPAVARKKVGVAFDGGCFRRVLCCAISRSSSGAQSAFTVSEGKARSRLHQAHGRGNAAPSDVHDCGRPRTTLTGCVTISCSKWRLSRLQNAPSRTEPGPMMLAPQLIILNIVRRGSWQPTAVNVHRPLRRALLFADSISEGIAGKPVAIIQLEGKTTF